MKTSDVVAGALTSLLLAAPAMAQVDLSGSWAARSTRTSRKPPTVPTRRLHRAPINDDARGRALSFTTSLLSQPERQCLSTRSYYLFGSPFQIRIWPEADPRTGTTIAWHVSGTLDRTPITIWMDGRPHPSQWERHTTAASRPACGKV